MCVSFLQAVYAKNAVVKKGNLGETKRINNVCTRGIRFVRRDVINLLR